MIALLTSLWTRVYGWLGQVSMYRLVMLALAALSLIAFVLSFLGLVVPSPGELIVTALVLGAVCVGVNAIAQRVVRMPARYESSLITAYILLFVLRPSLDPIALLGCALAGAIAVASKYAIAWRGRHILNPAAVGATVLTAVSAIWPDAGLGASAWWVGTPVLAVPVVVLGLAVLLRTERLRIVLVFLLVAVGITVVRQGIQAQQFGIAFDPWTSVGSALWSFPFLFLGAFMLSEPLTLPPRRWQQFTVAAIVGVLAGWPIPIGDAFTLGQERALLIGNLIGFVWATHRIVRLRFEDDRMLTPTVREVTFRTRRRLRFTAGQYLELEVPHRRPDARGTRREFSIVSAPSDTPLVRIAYRVKEGARESTYKQALAQASPGVDYAATGVWGDFVLPRDPAAPLVLVAAGIGVTPFVSQLREARARGEQRDVVVVYVASESAELAYLGDLAGTAASGGGTGMTVRGVIFTRDRPDDVPVGWEWAQGVRLDAEGLRRVVPDLAARHAYISGPPALIAALAPTLESARSLTTDAFSGY